MTCNTESEIKHARHDVSDQYQPVVARDERYRTHHLREIDLRGAFRMTLYTTGTKNMNGITNQLLGSETTRHTGCVAGIDNNRIEDSYERVDARNVES